MDHKSGCIRSCCDINLREINFELKSLGFTTVRGFKYGLCDELKLCTSLSMFKTTKSNTWFILLNNFNVMIEESNLQYNVVLFLLLISCVILGIPEGFFGY